MKHDRHRPKYALDEVRSLAACGSLRINRRSLNWIRNHLDRFDGSAVVRKVVDGIREEDFYKSVDLKFRTGILADVYRFVLTGDEELDSEDGWYVKLYIDEEDGEVHLEVLSANWEGYIQ